MTTQNVRFALLLALAVAAAALHGCDSQRHCGQATATEPAANDAPIYRGSNPYQGLGFMHFNRRCTQDFRLPISLWHYSHNRSNILLGHYELFGPEYYLDTLDQVQVTLNASKDPSDIAKALQLGSYAASRLEELTNIHVDVDPDTEIAQQLARAHDMTLRQIIEGKAALDW